MNNPLKIDAETKKTFDITPEVDNEDVEKLGFCRAQRDEYRKMLWRERVELIIARRQAESKDQIVQIESAKNVMSHTSGIEQFVRAIKVLNELIAELESIVSE